MKDGREEMYCGESGSTLRFLLPVMGALGHKASFYPEGRLPERPLSPLYEELIAHGCRLSPQGSVPFYHRRTVDQRNLSYSRRRVQPVHQRTTLALPVLAGDSRIVGQRVLQSKSYVDMTVKVLMDFGIEIIETAEGYLVPGGRPIRDRKTTRWKATGLTAVSGWRRGHCFLRAYASKVQPPLPCREINRFWKFLRSLAQL